MKKIISYGLLLSLVTVFNTTPAFAVGSGGFENAGFSSISLAQGNAVVAQAEEPAVISYNPAGITEVPGIQFQYNAAFISLFTFYEDNGPRQQESTRSSGTIVASPTAYLTFNPGKKFGLNERLSLGVGMDAPFGLKNKYDSRHPIVRYTSGSTNHLQMFSIKPVLGFKLTDKLSIGAGPVWYRVFNAEFITEYPNFAVVAGSADGRMRTEASGNRWGWHAGAQWRPHEKHHFGFYFRSPVNIKLKGQTEVDNAVLAGNIKVGAQADLKLPLNITGAYAWRPNKKSVIEADLGWTKWSDHKRLRINNDSVNTSAVAAINAGHDALIDSLSDGQADYSDVFSLHLGGSYKATKKLTLRAGGHFYWTPIPKSKFRPNIPDSNSLGLALGLSYQMYKWLGVDATYYNRFWFKRDVDNELSESLGTSVDGTYRSYAQEFVLTTRYFWDAFGSEPEPMVFEKEESGVRDESDYVEKSFWQFWK